MTTSQLQDLTNRVALLLQEHLLDPEEREVFAHLLTAYPHWITASRIARNTGIPRPVVFSRLHRLLNAGLILTETRESRAADVGLYNLWKPSCANEDDLARKLAEVPAPAPRRTRNPFMPAWTQPTITLPDHDPLESR